MNKTKIEWTDYIKGWIEALIDGEGSLSLLKERRPHFKAGVTFKPRLGIGNKDVKLLIHAKEIIGAGCIIGPNKKDFYNFDLSANGIRWLLPKIRLISKEEQRLLLLEALQILNRHAGRSIPRTDEELQRLEEICHLIRSKNGKKWNKK